LLRITQPRSAADCEAEAVATRQFSEISFGNCSKQRDVQIDMLTRQIMQSRVIEKIFGIGFLLWFSAMAPLRASSEGASVIVLYNTRLRESKQLAEYYAAKRNVPSDQVFGFDLPEEEAISRKEFRERLQRPLLTKIERKKWLIWPSSAKSSKSADPLDVSRLPSEAKIRYVVLCDGVPLRILEDPKLSESEMTQVRPELRRNEAAVDTELALLPFGDNVPLYGPIPSRVAGATNAVDLDPTKGVLMVVRLDAPSFALARGLIDKALQADADGLWGRAYFDARGLTNGTTRLGDEWIKGAAEVTRRLGFETIVDDKDERFSPNFPMSQIAFYAGWYEYGGQISGPFTRPTVEFMPGAFAYHLHSYSAQTVRSAIHGWVGPLLDKGATITMGSVHEPFLEFTPNLAIFVHRLIYLGFSFGEAAYASHSFLSWQGTIVGDPLYRPFRKKPHIQHEEFGRTKNKLIEWSHLKVVNINLANGVPAQDLIAYLEDVSDLKQSAVLLEKMADLHVSRGKLAEAMVAYSDALKAGGSRQQQIRVALALAQIQEFSGKLDEAYATYQEFIKNFPDYPDLLTIYKKLVPLSGQLKKATDREQYQREVDRLTGSSGKS
jgi:uncharacterized protein (TIGR03790 family)